MEHKNYITINGYNRLKDELHDLVVKQRPQLVETINWAASNGDRSENADYIYGKRKLREVDRRIHVLTKKLEEIEVVDSSVHKGKDKIFFGAQVTILKNDKIELTVTIVGKDEINPSLNHISWISPLARALIGKVSGDIIYLEINGNRESIEILEVEYMF